MDENNAPFLPHGGYRKLRSYKVAEAVYDATVVFCRRFFAHDHRMSDQMIQAARSGVRNISEASGAAATSRKTEMKLTNVARASLSDELLRDYETFLIQNGLRVWPKDSREARAMRSRLAQDRAPDLPPTPSGGVRLTGLSGLSEFVAQAVPELAGNAMLCAVNQAAYLLSRQLKSQGQTFLESGGFTENLYASRIQRRDSDKAKGSDASDRSDPSDASDGRGASKNRGSSDQSDRSDGSDGSDASDKHGASDRPICPRCGKPMRQRVARKGAKAWQPFWGCSDYPDCTGVRPIPGPNEPSH
ncbi:MAG: four helix bundle suffix domain-containing protein [Candidatus Sumerlaeota bacterium]|nr:four helix bundle suffix domain-containing protein [Candidatus Sumerlaeota bacterium]